MNPPAPPAATMPTIAVELEISINSVMGLVEIQHHGN
jgi:hypothetical protein